MRDVSHTHPHNARGAGPVFVRGPRVAADGGEREAVSEDEHQSVEDDERTDDDRTTDENGDPMEEVDHTPPYDDEGANRVFARGGEEVREESVDDE